jgi:sec-independent protein translocase protein TatA
MPFRLGGPELIIILVIVIIVFGVGRLPEVGGALGKGIRAFRRGQEGSEGSDGSGNTKKKTKDSSAKKKVKV